MPHPADHPFDFSWNEVGAGAPFVLLVVFGALGMLFEIILPAKDRRSVLYWTGVLGFLAAGTAAVTGSNEGTTLLFGGAMRRDGLSGFLGAAVLGMGFLSYLQAADFAVKRGVPLGGLTLLYLFGACWSWWGRTTCWSSSSAWR